MGAYDYNYIESNVPPEIGALQVKASSFLPPAMVLQYFCLSPRLEPRVLGSVSLRDLRGREQRRKAFTSGEDTLGYTESDTWRVNTRYQQNSGWRWRWNK